MRQVESSPCPATGRTSSAPAWTTRATRSTGNSDSSKHLAKSIHTLIPSGPLMKIRLNKRATDEATMVVAAVGFRGARFGLRSIPPAGNPSSSCIFNLGRL